MDRQEWRRLLCYHLSVVALANHPITQQQNCFLGSSSTNGQWIDVGPPPLNKRMRNPRCSGCGALKDKSIHDGQGREEKPESTQSVEGTRKQQHPSPTISLNGPQIKPSSFPESSGFGRAGKYPTLSSSDGQILVQ